MRTFDKKPLTYEQALFKATAYCALCEHCEAEVREKLAAWNAASSDFDRIIDYLFDENYLNEQRFAKAFVRDKFRFNQWGKTKIGLMLRTKKIDSETICEALDQISDDDYRTTLLDLIERKNRTIKTDDSRERYAKLVRFAMSRGFEYDIIAKTIDGKLQTISVK